MKNEHREPTLQSTEPEYFPSALLTQPKGARQEYFEQQCLIEHPRLLETLDATIQAICHPGEGASMRRPGTMVLVIGPTRVGKTTFIHLLEERLFSYARAQMEQDPGFIPFSSVTTAGPEASRFDWQTYYKAVLRGLRDPFVDGKTARIPTRELREAMESALLHRKPLAIIVDEAHHLAAAASGSRLQSQLNHLKYFENATGVSHIMYHQKSIPWTGKRTWYARGLRLGRPVPATRSHPHRLPSHARDLRACASTAPYQPVYHRSRSKRGEVSRTLCRHTPPVARHILLPVLYSGSL